MSVVALVQARMGSSRLPGKVLMEIAGRNSSATMLRWVMWRAAQAPGVDGVILCVSGASDDEPLSQATADVVSVAPKSIPTNDVLGRMAFAARRYPLDTLFVRITADCPLIDPWLIGDVVRYHRAEEGCSLTSLTVSDGTGWPDGLDVEVFNGRILADAHAAATSPEDREHVTGWMRRHYPVNLLTPLDTKYFAGLPQKWSVDTQEDLEFVREVYEALGDGLWGCRAVVNYLRRKALREAVAA